MQSVIHSPGFIKRRKFLLMLPVLVLPFIVILFFILGGGKRKHTALENEKQTGLNLQLPDAHFLKKKEPDKLGLYEVSSKDSDSRRMAIRNDPYRSTSGGMGHHVPEKNVLLKDIFEKTAANFPGEDLEMKKSLSNGQKNPEQKEQELMERLNRLKAQLEKPNPENETSHGTGPRPAEIPNREMAERFQKMKSEREPDPEMSQLNNMLDKVMAIQHPGLIFDTLQKATAEQKGRAYPVHLNPEENAIQTFGGTVSGESFRQDSTNPFKCNRFFGLDEDQSIKNKLENSFKAIVPESQVLVAGSTIKVQLEIDISINGHMIPKGQLIYGTCTLNNERLKINFSSVRSGNNILPVSLQAYDLDGLPGIFIPGSIPRDAVKQSGDQAIGGLGLSTLDPSIGAQAASAGIQTAKTLLSRKVRLVKVTVKAGYQVLLKDERH